MDADEIRRIYLEFMVERGHVVIPRAPLIPKDDPTTLFTGSGMQPLLPYLLGADHPAGHRLTDSQTCLRVQDIEEVGDNRHTTFFEMLGNWSLGDYFKTRAAAPVLGIPDGAGRARPEPDLRHLLQRRRGQRHPARTPSPPAIWTELFTAAGISADQVDLGTEEHGAEVGSQGARIAFYGKKNWWCRGGKAENMPVGEPGGPDSEVFYLYPQIEHDPAYGAHCHQNCDCGRFIELGNSVFMEYKKTETGFEPLPRKNVDYGGGLARIAAASMDSPDVYRINLLWPIVAAAGGAVRQQLRHRHGRDAGDRRPPARRDVPGRRRGQAEQQGAGLRDAPAGPPGDPLRVRPRAGAELLPADHPDHRRACTPTTTRRSPSAATQVIAVLVKEEKAFRQTLRKGIKQLGTTPKTGITGTELFTLYDTFGFPVELSTEEARLQGIAVSAELAGGVRREDGRAAARSQQASKMKI